MQKLKNRFYDIIGFIGFFYLLGFFHELGHLIGFMIFQEYIPTRFFIRGIVDFGWKMTTNNPPTILGALCYFLVIPIILEVIVVYAAKKNYWWLLIIAYGHNKDITNWLILIDSAIM